MKNLLPSRIIYTYFLYTRAQGRCPLCQAGVDPPGPPGGDVEHESWCLAGGGSREAGPGPGDTEDEDSATCQHRIKDLYTTHTED